MAIGEEFTKQLIAKAGITDGNVVLDYGCGTGDVTFLLAKVVGPHGAVVGIDRDSASLQSAEQRAADEGLSNVIFREAVLDDLPSDLGSFDAMVGRRVLMYLTDPVQVVKTLVAHLKPGGVFASHEHDFAFDHPTNEVISAHKRAKDLVLGMLAAENARNDLGPELPALLKVAGLQVGGAIASAIIQTPNDPYPIADMLMAVKDRLIAAHGGTDDDLMLEQLAEDLARERSEHNIYWADTMFGAWGTKK